MVTSSVFLTHFIIGLMVSSFTVVIILLIKKLFQKQLSAKWHYNLWFLLLIALTLPFLSNHLLTFDHPIHLFEGNPKNGLGGSAHSTGAQVIQNVNWLQDFTISVNRFTPDYLNYIIAGIWMAGVFIFAVLTLRAWVRIGYIKKTTTDLMNKEVRCLFEECKQNLKISGHVVLGESPLVKSPVTFGLFRTYVVLPLHLDEWMSEQEIRYILMHELNHYKNKDMFTNYFIVIYQILYWFNPLIWMAFRKMRLDREIACDTAVLHGLDECCYTEYGETIICFAGRVSKSTPLQLANYLNDSKEQLKRRIERISTFETETKMLRLKSITIFIFAGILVASQIPFIPVMADDNARYNFNNERTVYEDLSPYFSGFEGSFVLYRMQADQYHIYNEKKSLLRVSPDSTYKIFGALFALEENLITRENSTMKWNGELTPYEAWNQDQDLITAMKRSVNWYFEDLDKKIPRDRMQDYLEVIGYGNQDLSGGVAQYWQESSLKTSPVEQVQLLKAFYTNQFGFQEKNIDTVKKSIQLDEISGSRLSGKTGTGAVNNQDINGWFIGYVETKEDTYFFATNIQKGDHSNGSKAAEITLSILGDKGIY